MTYEERIGYILDLPRFTKKNLPAHTRELLERLGNPQEQFAVVHVAGSNGKGSVCAFISRVLKESGLHVGMFASPHLVELRERFLLDGCPCSRAQFSEAEECVRREVREMTKEGKPHPAFFEYLFAVGMVIFARAGVDCGVLETGLGGRLDATNVVKKPLVTVITSISLEHTEILGDTIQQIAAEKAGIIKPGTPVIYDDNEPLAGPVIRAAARRQQAPAQGISYKNIKYLLNDGKKIDFSLDCGYDVTTDIRIPFAADYQAMNAALALAAVLRLRESFSISDDAVRRGFLHASWPGRMEEVCSQVYLDGAHNPAGMQAFLQAVERLADGPSILLMAMVKDKNYRQAVRLLLEKGSWEQIILTKIRGNPRALQPQCLKRCFEEVWAEREASQEIPGSGAQSQAVSGAAEEAKALGVRAALPFAGGRRPQLLVIEDPAAALQQALEHRQAGQTLFCTGSLYLIGDLKKVIGGWMDD